MDGTYYSELIRRANIPRATLKPRRGNSPAETVSPLLMKAVLHTINAAAPVGVDEVAAEQETLAKNCSASARQVRRAIRGLVALSLLVVEFRRCDRLGKTVNHYRILADELSRLTPSAGLIGHAAHPKEPRPIGHSCTERPECEDSMAYRSADRPEREDILGGSETDEIARIIKRLSDLGCAATITLPSGATVTVSTVQNTVTVAPPTEDEILACGPAASPPTGTGTGTETERKAGVTDQQTTDDGDGNGEGRRSGRAAGQEAEEPDSLLGLPPSHSRVTRYARFICDRLNHFDKGRGGRCHINPCREAAAAVADPSCYIDELVIDELLQYAQKNGSSAKPARAWFIGTLKGCRFQEIGRHWRGGRCWCGQRNCCHPHEDGSERPSKDEAEKRRALRNNREMARREKFQTTDERRAEIQAKLAALEESA